MPVFKLCLLVWTCASLHRSDGGSACMHFPLSPSRRTPPLRVAALLHASPVAPFVSDNAQHNVHVTMTESLVEHYLAQCAVCDEMLLGTVHVLMEFGWLDEGGTKQPCGLYALLRQMEGLCCSRS